MNATLEDGSQVSDTPRTDDITRPTGTFEDDCVMVVIETPKRSRNYGTFVLKNVLPAGAVFPFGFGFRTVHACRGRRSARRSSPDGCAGVFWAHCVFTTQSDRVQGRDLGRS